MLKGLSIFFNKLARLGTRSTATHLGSIARQPNYRYLQLKIASILEFFSHGGHHQPPS